jgi:hypothetical protein
MTDTLLTAPEVEVWCAFTRRWVRGFRLAETQPDGTVILLGRGRAGRLSASVPSETVRSVRADPEERNPWR